MAEKKSTARKKEAAAGRKYNKSPEHKQAEKKDGKKAKGK